MTENETILMPGNGGITSTWEVSDEDENDQNKLNGGDKATDDDKGDKGDKATDDWQYLATEESAPRERSVGSVERR